VIAPAAAAPKPATFGFGDLIPLLCCPSCRRPGREAALANRGDTLVCVECQASFPVEDGIPNFLPPTVRAPAAPAEAGDRQKWQQRTWHDQHELAEWNIGDPHHAPLKEYCLYRQMQSAADLLPRELARAPILSLCCGSGLEAEFFAQSVGQPVVGVDISPGMVRNAITRARRAGYAFAGVCADAENLPFRSGSFVLAVVLHGLHHLEVPARGLQEMARVSRGALCIFEPATSPIRAALMRVGAIPRTEESGNVSYDFSERSGFAELLRTCGFDAVVFRRELWSLWVSELRLANRPPLLAAAQRAFEWLHRGSGPRWGTKLTVVAWRSGARA
jgi:SAM-dependent methyltransferase